MSIPNFEEIVETNDQTEARSEHLEKLRELVGNVYPNKFVRSSISGTEDTISALIACEPVANLAAEMAAVKASLKEGERPSADVKDTINGKLKEFGNVRIAGRLTTPPRGNFVHLTDGKNKLQIYCKKNLFVFLRNDSTDSLDSTDSWTAWGLIDHGDFIGVEGYLFVTNTGEVSVHVEKLQFLAKAMLPMPDKMHGIADAEIKQRQRYVDLIGSSLQVKSEPPASAGGLISTANESGDNENVPAATSLPPAYAGGTDLSTREVFERRAKIISSMRRYLEDHGYIEVETPMLTPKATGAAAKPFKTHHNALDIDLYARIAPELYLKRLVVGGFEKVYELNRNFRNEGISYKHNPEFTMLEFYCAYMDVEGMMNFCEEMMQESIRKATGGSLKLVYRNTDPRVLGIGSSYDVTIDFDSFQRLTMEESIVTGIPSLMDWYFKHVSPPLATPVSDWLTANFGDDHKGWFAFRPNAGVLLEQLAWLSSFDNLMNEVYAIDDNGEPQDIAEDESLSSIFSKLSEIASSFKDVELTENQITETVLRIFDDHIESVVGIVRNDEETIVNPTFIIDYPKSISPLSKASPENPQIAERFELFINGMEVANGFSELNDPREQYDRFVDQMSERERGDEEAMILDEDYIRALSYGMPPAAGIGIGIDRLVMLLTNKHSIRDVILFPHMRPEKNTQEETE